MRSADTFDTEAANILYYCFIKPYQGLVFRRIGETDERNNKVYVDEDMTEIEDVPYSEIKDAVISKIVENGDLLSNQLIVNITFDYYEGNDNLALLMATRKEKWIDPIRMNGNPDWILVEFDDHPVPLRIIENDNEGIIAENEDNGRSFLIKRSFESCER